MTFKEYTVVRIAAVLEELGLSIEAAMDREDTKYADGLKRAVREIEDALADICTPAKKRG